MTANLLKVIKLWIVLGEFYSDFIAMGLFLKCWIADNDVVMIKFGV